MGCEGSARRSKISPGARATLSEREGKREDRLRATRAGFLDQWPPRLCGCRAIDREWAAKGSFGRLAYAPDDSHPRQDLQRVVAYVHLPPEEPLPSAVHVVVMVVVPPLTEGDEGEQGVIAGLITGCIAARPPDVAE